MSSVNKNFLTISIVEFTTGIIFLLFLKFSAIGGPPLAGKIYIFGLIHDFYLFMHIML